MQPYVKSTQLFVCPSDSNKQIGYGASFPTSYGCNSTASGDSDSDAAVGAFNGYSKDGYAIAGFNSTSQPSRSPKLGAAVGAPNRAPCRLT